MADPAKSSTGNAAPGLYQRSRFPASALAGCSTDPALTVGSDAETGVTIMQMDVGLDTGDMLLKLSCPITAEDTSGSLYDKLADLGLRG